MTAAAGILVEQLAVTGAGLPDAVLKFEDGLNVIAGASDTGKSYAFQCIDYALGAGKPPKRITESAGYQFVTLRLVVRATGERWEIQRSLGGGEVLLRKVAADGTMDAGEVLAAKHAAENPDTISGRLLQWCGLWGKKVRTRARGDQRTLSFRDVAHLIMGNETRLFDERPPQYSGQYATRVAEGDVLRLLVTGHESAPVIALPSKKEIAINQAKEEVVGEMLAAAEREFLGFGVLEAELEAEIGRVERAREAALVDFDESRGSTVELEGQLAAWGRELRDTQARTAVVEGLQKRFDLLATHYDSDLNRLQTISETGFLLESFATKSCPVCGAAPAKHRPKECAPAFRVEDVQQAARGEMTKIETLRVDLRKVLADLGAERLQLGSILQEATGEMETLRQKIGGELMPRIRQSTESLRAQDSHRDRLNRAEMARQQLRQLRDFAGTFTSMEVASVAPSEAETVNTTGELDLFAQAVGELLTSWKFPYPGRVIYSENEEDLVVGGQLRSAHGTGIRALTCAAFLLGIARHCQLRALAHPSLVVLDSPLLAYQEPDQTKISAEDQQLRHAGIKEAFYADLAAGGVGGQIIVFENDDPPSDLMVGVTRTHFTKSELGRFGFFPPRP
jgi:hypothetical protein